MRIETETRWIVLGTDGRHVSLGRTEPSEAEVKAASDALAAQGHSRLLGRMRANTKATSIRSCKCCASWERTSTD
jgi:hypothetical protein